MWGTFRLTMPLPPPPAAPVVGPFVVRSRKGNFGNQDLASVLRLALAHRHEEDMEFVESGSGRCFTCVELIAVLDRQDHRPESGAMPTPPPAAPPGQAVFRTFATSTVDLDLLPGDLPPPPPPVPSGPRRSDRMAKRSDRRRAVDGGNALLIGALAFGVVILGLGYLLLQGR